MKSFFSIQKLIFFLALSITAIIACKKTETITINVQEPTARFSVLIPDPYSSYHSQGTTTYIDSNFYFQNTSDSGTKITYHWDFGDGTTATDKNTKHSYSKRGNYKVTLTVSNDNKAFDSLQQTVSVVLGQQHISLGPAINLSPVAIEETATNEFVVLGATGYGTGYSLFQLDTLLQQKSMKTFPAGYHLTSMKAAGDGNYIFTGSTQSIDKGNELIKMKADGTQLWNKVLSANDAYSFATPTLDGGYMVIGSRSASSGNGTNNYTVAIKTDGNGNQQWQRLLDQEGMINTKNALVEQDGIVVAGTKRGLCMECDSIFVIKLNNTGSVVWKNAVLGGMNNFTWWDTRITKLTNGNYAVSNGYTRGIFFFSPSGDFLDRKLAPSQVAGVIGSSDGNLIVLQTEPGNGSRINVSKLSLDGVQQWYANPDGREKLSGGGYSCCSSSWPVTIQPLRNGGTIVTGYRANSNIPGYGIYTATLILELDEAGKPK